MLSLAKSNACFPGLQCGKILKHFNGHLHRVLRMIVWGLLLSAIGAALAEFQKNGGLIPLNKNLWYVSTALCIFKLGLGYLFVQSVQPFSALGGCHNYSNG